MSDPMKVRQVEKVEQKKIESLVANLNDKDGLRRQEARLELVEIGEAAVAALIAALHDPSEHVRWEAAKALSEIGDPQAVPALIMALEDPSFGVRWLAAEGLIAVRERGLAPLLEALIHHSDSTWLRQGVHHVLRTMATEYNLHGTLALVLKALDDYEPELEAPAAAAHALKTLRAERA
jgi:HEAT repeat protein